MGSVQLSAPPRRARRKLSLVPKIGNRFGALPWQPASWRQTLLLDFLPMLVENLRRSTYPKFPSHQPLKLHETKLGLARKLWISVRWNKLGLC